MSKERELIDTEDSLMDLVKETKKFNKITSKQTKDIISLTNKIKWLTVAMLLMGIIQIFIIIYQNR